MIDLNKVFVKNPFGNDEPEYLPSIYVGAFSDGTRVLYPIAPVMGAADSDPESPSADYVVSGDEVENEIDGALKTATASAANRVILL